MEDRKRAESLLAGENRVLEMTAKGNSLESILETLCRVVEQTADGCYCSVILIDPSNSKIEQAIAPSLPSTYKNRFSGIAVDRDGGSCTEAALRKKQVIVPDVVSDTRWGTYGRRTDALAHGLKTCWSSTILASNGVVLGIFAISWRESRSPNEQDQKIIEQIETEDTLAFSVLENIRPMIETAPLEQAADAYARMMEGKARFRMELVTKELESVRAPGMRHDRRS